MNHLLIIDGNHLASRHRHVLGDLRDDQGKRTGVVFGFLASMRKITTEQVPNHIIVVFDYGKSLRKQKIRSSYKNKARTTDEQELREYFSQLNELPIMLSLIGTHVIRAYRVEADDIIGILCYYYLTLYTIDRITIVSSDSDLLQLLSQQVTMLDEVNHRHWNPTYFTETEKYQGLNPEDIILLKALTGDSSDRIEGCPGIGHKTATWLLEQIDSVEDLLDEERVAQLAIQNPRCKSLLNPEVIQRLVENVSLIQLPTGVTDLDKEEMRELGGQLAWHKPQIEEEQFRLYAAKWSLMNILAKGKDWFDPFHTVQWNGEIFKH